MNLDELRSVQNAERRKSGLQSLRESFYEDAGEYVASLKAERERAAERASDPFSDPDVQRLTDEIETAEEVIEAIYERRMGKLLKRASLAAAQMSADEDGLTVEEQRLFHDIVERIRQNKSTVLDEVVGDAEATRSGESADPEPDPAAPADREDSGGVSAADAMGSGTDSSGSEPGPASDPSGEAADATPVENGDGPREVPPDEQGPPGRPPDGADARADDRPGSDDAPPDPTVEDERVPVRITSDVGEIVGVDEREYELVAEDVVELPEQNAQPLLQRDAAERLD